MKVGDDRGFDTVPRNTSITWPVNCGDNLCKLMMSRANCFRGYGEPWAVGETGSLGNKQNMPVHSILLISADAALGKKTETAINEQFQEMFDWEHAESLFDGLRLLQERSFQLIISDLFLPDGQGLATLRHLKQHAPEIPVIVLCHSRDRDVAVNAVRKGAHDFFCFEDLDGSNLKQSISAALNAELSPEDEAKAAERRTSARFPCRLAVAYQTLEYPFLSGQGSSETLNISSKGLLFTTGESLEPGKLLQVSVDWPAKLENQIPLKLVAEGRVIRCSNGTAAMRIDKYEFRTRKMKVPAPAPAAR